MGDEGREDASRHQTSPMNGLLHARGKRLGHIAVGDRLQAIKRLQRVRVVEMNDGVELPWQARMKIVAEPFRFRPVNDTDRALQAGLGQRFACGGAFIER